MDGVLKFIPHSFSHLSNTEECLCAMHTGRLRVTTNTSLGSRIEVSPRSKDMTYRKGIMWSRPCLPIGSLFLLFPFCSWGRSGSETFAKSPIEGSYSRFLKRKTIFSSPGSHLTLIFQLDSGSVSGSHLHYHSADLWVRMLNLFLPASCNRCFLFWKYWSLCYSSLVLLVGFFFFLIFIWV